MCKIQIIENLINSIDKIQICESEKRAIDICILGFNDTTYTILDWMSLSEFNCNMKLMAKGNKSLNSIISTTIKKALNMQERYNECCINYKQTQIIVYTDGLSNEDMRPAYKEFQLYFNSDFSSPTAKLYMILTSTYNNGQLIKFDKENICHEFKHLVDGAGGNIIFSNIDVFENGIPRLMSDSIVLWS